MDAVHLKAPRVADQWSRGARGAFVRCALDAGFGGAIGVLEYIPKGCPEGSLTSPMAPVPFGRLKGNPGTSVPPSSVAFLQLS